MLRKSKEFETNLARRLGRLALPALAIGGMLLMATSAQAQIVYEGSGNANINSVCAFQNQLIIATTNECADPTDPSAFPTAIRIGSTSFQSSDGSVQFNGASTSFQNAVTLNGGITVTGGNIDMGNNQVHGVADPTADTDAANKRYVDQANAAQQTQINSNTTRITDAENVNASQQTQINSNTTRITDAENVNATQQTQIDSNTTRVTDVETVNSSQQIEIAALQTAVGSLNDTTDHLQSQINRLDQRDDELAEAIAIALALDQPFFHGGQTFAFNIGWGGYGGENAIGITAAGIVDRGSLGPTSTTTLHGGVGAGTGQGQVAGKAGVSFGW